MKKLGSRLTAVLSLVLVFSMVLGSTNKAFAGVDNHGFNDYKTKVDSDSGKYSDDEAAKIVAANESTYDKLESAEEAQNAVKAVAEAADAAEKAVAGIAEELEAAKAQKSAAESKAEEAATQNTNIETAVNKLGEAEIALDAKVGEEKQAEETLKSDVAAYNKDAEAAQKALDAAADKLDEAMKKASGTMAEDSKTAEELKAAALKAFEATVNTDDEERIENAAKVAEILSEAGALVSKANSDEKAAERARKKAIDEYNKYAMMYGEPLYGESDITYDTTKATKAAEKEELIADSNSIQNTNLLTLEQNIKAAETQAKEAQTKRNEAIADAKTAISNINEIAGKADTELTSGKTNLEDAKKADEKVEKAADDTINYYVNKAQASLDETNRKIEANNEMLANAQKAQNAAQTAYDDAVASLTKKGEDAFNAELKKLEQAKTDAQNKYNRASGWDRFWNVGNVCTNLNEANKAYNNYNKESVKQSVINNTLKSSSEYSSLQQAIGATQSIRNVANELESERTAKTETLKKAETAVSRAEETYLKDLEAAGEEALKALNAEIAKYSDDINQVEYDQDVFDWAEEYFNSWNIYTKGVVRRTINEYYHASYWEQLGDAIAIFHWTVSGENVDAKMDAIMGELAEKIRIAEEKKADTIARCAKLEADADIASAETAVEKAEQNAKSIGDIKGSTLTIEQNLNGLDKQCDAAIAAAEQKITEAESTLENIKAAANSDIENLDEISLKKLLDSINAAERAVQTAKNQVKSIKNIQETIKTYNDLAASYAAYDNENSNVAVPSATAYAQIVNGSTADSNAAGFDETNPQVQSQSISYFTQVSESKGLTVPEEMFEAYLREIVAYEKDSTEGINVRNNGEGIATGDDENTEKATMPFVYWELDENDQLTGKYFTDSTKLDGKYFLGYSFKKEDDLGTIGYHIDGYFVTLEAQEEEEAEIIVVVDENGQLSLGGSDYMPVVVLDVVEVPQGDAESVDDTENETIDLDEVKTPEADVEVAEVLPQTGTASVVIFYTLGVGCIALGGVVAHMARKEDEKNEAQR